MIHTNKGPKLWNKAKTLIPGGSQLLSKRSEMFLPDNWPSYYQKAKGVKVIDLDGNKLIDMSLMGVGACILGYADKDVNKAVNKAIKEGSMCTLNCPEEVTLAEEFLKLNPWADMVRYAKTGGESTSIAIRIARAYTKKSKVIFCGYHGWSDWYLSANISEEENLDNHLIKGLKPSGVPKELKNTAIPFEYNDIKTLKKIVAENSDIAAIIVEPIRYIKPKDDFLQKVAKIAKQKKAVLIFDEITTGMRLRLGGAFENYNVKPDIVVYGKAIANGYPMGIIVGKKKIMDAAQESFISSTFWTERTGLVAAIATLKKLKEKHVSEHLIKIGKLIKKGWLNLAKKNKLKIKIMGIDPLATFHFEEGEQSQILHTLFTQEMLKRGYLASKAVYVSYSHNERIIKKYLKTVDKVFSIIKEASKLEHPEETLDGPVAHEGFKRLN